MVPPLFLPGRIWQANSYISGSLLIDAGVDVSRIFPYRNQIRKVVLTHGHFDHIVHAKEIAEVCNADIYIGEYDLEFLTNSALSLAGHFGANQPKLDAHILKDGDVIEGFKVYHTPGHTRGSICLFKDGCLFSGDTVFPEGSYGRTDLPTGSADDIRLSLKRIATLPIESLYCGHGEPVNEGARSHVLLSAENV